MRTTPPKIDSPSCNGIPNLVDVAESHDDDHDEHEEDDDYHELSGGCQQIDVDRTRRSVDPHLCMSWQNRISLV